MYQPPLPFPDWQDIEYGVNLSPDILSNLTHGTPIPTEINNWNPAPSLESVSNILTRLLIEDPGGSTWLNCYTNPAFKTNLGCYLTLFCDPRLNRSSEPPNIEFIDPMRDQGTFPKECIFTHGRFNGVPHPGYLNSIAYAKQQYPHLPVTLAIETDEYSIREGQNPFLNVVLRASILHFTGLIDRVVIIRAPYHGDDIFDEGRGGINLYWDYMYGVDTGIINPCIIIAYGEEDLQRKKRRVQMRNNIMSIDTHEIQQSASIHMSDIRNNTIDNHLLIEEWARLLNRLGDTVWNSV